MLNLLIAHLFSMNEQAPPDALNAEIAIPAEIKTKTEAGNVEEASRIDRERIEGLLKQIEIDVKKDGIIKLWTIDAFFKSIGAGTLPDLIENMKRAEKEGYVIGAIAPDRSFWEASDPRMANNPYLKLF